MEAIKLGGAPDAAADGEETVMLRAEPWGGDWGLEWGHDEGLRGGW